MIGCESVAVCVEEEIDDEVMGWVFLRTTLQVATGSCGASLLRDGPTGTLEIC